MNFNEFMTRFSIQLNEQQLQAVKSVEQPTLLLAVPGSGKTTVLVTRLAYMIYVCGIRPENILTVTYTVAATRDMKQRFAAKFGAELSEKIQFRTINGICAKIISYYGSCVGKKPYELVSDEKFKTALLSAIYQQTVKEYPTESDLKNVSTQITYIKNRMLSKEEIDSLGKEQELPLYEIYTKYCTKMREQSLMDYDDQMVYALIMLKKTPQMLSYFQNQYQYLCVDEAQDTSKIQHEIIRILSGNAGHLFMVGDEDQSIYGFRAAYPEALLEFENTYTNAKVLLMEENFRSNAKIVHAADAFIQKNEFRHKKTMKPFREAGADIQKIEIHSRRAQYAYLLKVAQNCTEETAVLYRDNESVLPLIDLLERNNVPYRMRNADFSFFSHRIISDIKNIIAFAKDQTDTELFLRIYYKLNLHINKKTATDACEGSRRNGTSVLEQLLLERLPVKTKQNVRNLQSHLQLILQEPADKAIFHISFSMGYGAYLKRSNMKDNKIKILEMLAKNEPDAERLVERLQELSDVIKAKQYDKDCPFILSTIHSSKGLEYDRVYLIDVKDEIFPENVVKNKRDVSLEERKLYEEERRLFYVGVTRAKNNLAVFYFDGDSTFGKEFFQFSGTKPSKGKKAASWNTGTQQLKKAVTGQMLSKEKQGTKKITETEYYDKLEELKTTGYVKHKVYGEGMIVSMRGDTLEIQFEEKIVKCKLKFMMEHALIE